MACLQHSNVSSSPENMLRNSTKMWVHGQVIFCTSFSPDGVHATAFQEKRLVYNDPQSEIQSGDGRLSQILFFASTKVMTVQRHHCFARKVKKCLGLKNVSVKSISMSTPNLRNAENSLWEMFREGFPGISFCAWYASNVVQSHHKFNKWGSQNIVTEDCVYSEPRKKKSCQNNIFQQWWW